VLEFWVRHRKHARLLLVLLAALTLLALERARPNEGLWVADAIAAVTAPVQAAFARIHRGATGLWTIADDSGLAVDALGGEPGVKSARYSGEKLPGEERTLLDHRNMKKVLELLDGVPKEKRTARFICCLCLASPKKVLLETTGKVEGVITDREIGTDGFGYDPIVFIPDMGKTVAQMTAEEKNSISHRGNAIRKLKPMLDELLRG